MTSHYDKPTCLLIVRLRHNIIMSTVVVTFLRLSLSHPRDICMCTAGHVYSNSRFQGVYIRMHACQSVSWAHPGMWL